MAAIVARAVPVSRNWPEGTNSNVASILILGGDADGNLGDRAIQQAMCGSFAALRPGLEIAVVSDAADRVRQSWGAGAIRRGLRGLHPVLSRRPP